MLGSTLFRVLSKNAQYQVYGSVRNSELKKFFKSEYSKQIITDLDVLNTANLKKVILQLNPQVIINCVGLVKQLTEAKNPLISIPLNSLLPHQLLKIAGEVKARVIQISTDCVFSGHKGQYLESDFSDAEDLYGRSKYLGELDDYDNAITLRTSIIGHELTTHKSLIDWFLSQEIKVKGYRQVIFSGLPTIEMAHIIEHCIIPEPQLHGLYHISAKPINKYDLLKLVAEIYHKKIEITADDQLKIDRSLNSERFTRATGYVSPEWKTLITKMHENREQG